MGGSRCKLPRPSESESDPRPECITYVVFVFSNLWRSRQSHDAADRFSDLVQRFLSEHPCWWWGGAQNFLFLVPEPAISGPDVMSHTQSLSDQPLKKTAHIY
jgi:hypothetical protein